MRASILLPVWLAPLVIAAADVDSCNYLVTNPLAADILRAKKACITFQQSTLSLCPTTSTVTKTTTKTAPTTTVTATETTVDVASTTLISTFFKTRRVTTSTTTSRTDTSTIQETTVIQVTSTTTLPAQPTGPIGGSQDTKRGLEERAAACPSSYGPDVALEFAFACKAPAFRAACVKLGVAATTKTVQRVAATSTVTTTITTTPTASVTQTVTVSSVKVVAQNATISTTVTTTAFITATVNANTTLTTSTTTVIPETNVPESNTFYLSGRGAAYNGPITETFPARAGDPIRLAGDYDRYYSSFRIGATQTLLTSSSAFAVYVDKNYVVRFSGYVDGRDPASLRCELTNPKATSGDLTCISGNPQSSLFQTCNNDGLLYHGPGLISSKCSTLQLYVSD